MHVFGSVTPIILKVPSTEPTFCLSEIPPCSWYPPYLLEFIFLNVNAPSLNFLPNLPVLIYVKQPSGTVASQQTLR